MEILQTIIALALGVNTLAAIFTVFKEKRENSATLAWLLVLFLLPGFGFIVYLFFGRKISKDQIYDLQTQKNIGIKEYVDRQLAEIEYAELNLDKRMNEPNVREMIQLFLNKGESPVTANNQVKTYDDGMTKFKDLLEDIEKAQDHVHIVYYIFRDDELGIAIVDALTRRARKGVEVRLMFDSLGSRGVKDEFFDELVAAGGMFSRTFESEHKIFNTNVNFRNHRKIMVVDGKVGYVGGFNVGDDYLGKYEKMGYWRDSHLRIVGDAVQTLQARFLMDWNASVRGDKKMTHDDKYFPRVIVTDYTLMQIVSSGPDSESQIIKKGFIKLIHMAEHQISIQSPYFIPDSAVMESLKIALASGIKVRIMIPNKPDHIFVHSATIYYARELVAAGGEVYIYDEGFMHSKTMLVDGLYSTVGTSNFDIRSFKLNFEINAFIYDPEVTQELEGQFESDIKKSYLLTPEIIDNFSLWYRFRQGFSRLFSPLL